MGFPDLAFSASVPGLSCHHEREDRSSEQNWAPKPAEAGGSCLIEGTAWATRTSWVGRAAEGDAAGKILPLGLAGLASFITVSRGHRPHCKSDDGTGGRNDELGQNEGHHKSSHGKLLQAGRKGGKASGGYREDEKIQRSRGEGENGAN